MAEQKNEKSKDESGFKGIKKADMEVLKKAAEMYTRLTGEAVKGVDSIPVLPEEGVSVEEQQKKAEEELKATAEATKKLEAARQEERQLRLKQAGGQDVDEEGKLKPILAPEAARQQELSKAGGAKREPAGVAREKSSTERATPSALGAKVSS